jgi:hypothetical protein
MKLTPIRKLRHLPAWIVSLSISLTVGLQTAIPVQANEFRDLVAYRMLDLQQSQ